MIETTIKYKVTLKLYASLSLFATIITLLYSFIHDLVVYNIYIPIGIICLLLIVFIFVLKSLVLDINSIELANKNENNSNFVEIKRIDKMALEFIAFASNFIIITLIYFYGFQESEGPFSNALSIAIIIFLFIPILILIQSILFEYFFDRHQIYSIVINWKTVIILGIGIIIILSNGAVNKIIQPVGKVVTMGDDTTLDISSNILIISISGERIDVSGAPISKININIKGTGKDVDIKSISSKYINETTTSLLKYDTVADGSHFSYYGKNKAKGDTILKMGDQGTIVINLSSIKQELYSYKKSTIQIIPGNDMIISKDFIAPEFKGDYILLYSNR